MGKNYVDPKSKLPHPSDRIANCLKECKVRVDANGDTRRMAEDAVKKMRGKLMFAKAVALSAKITIKHAHVGQCTNIIKRVATVVHEEWTGVGCVFTVELSKADMNTLQVALMKPTSGDYEMTFLDGSGGANDDNDESNGKKGKNKKGKKNKKEKKKSKSNDEQKTNDSSNNKKKKKKNKK